MPISFSKTILNDIRDRISIASFIGERIKLARSGRNYKGLCPFHNEKTPSFMVSDDKAMFHCFGCSEGGDVFKFVMKFDGMGFPEAVEYLAGIAGIELPRDTDLKIREREDEVSKKRRLAFRLNELVRDYFTSRLFDESAGARARQYLQDRGIHKEFWTQLFLGYADNSWDALGFYLSEKKVPTELGVELGLLKKRDGGGCYDFFRDRIMFPIVSARGEVLGFSGRDLSGSDTAKYVNSPDSIVYHKSSCVYGLNLAVNAIRSEDLAILVEGNIDLVSLQQAGIKNAVAPLGTALTAGHIKLLSRHTRNMTLVFDGDEAGSKAALRSLELFIDAGLSPRIVPLPGGEDPDSLVKKEGPLKFGARIKNAVPLFEYFVEQTISKTGLDSSGKVLAAEKIAPLLKIVPDPAHRAIYARHAARRLDMDEGFLLDMAARKRPPVRAYVKPAEDAKTGPLDPAERILVEIMLGHPSRAGGILEKIGQADFEDEWCGKIVKFIEADIEANGALDVERMIGAFADESLVPEIRKTAFDADKFDAEEIDVLVNDCIRKIKRKPDVSRIGEINAAIKIAETQGNEGRLFELLKEKRELAVNLKNKSEINSNSRIIR